MLVGYLSRGVKSLGVRANGKGIALPSVLNIILF